MYLKLDVYQTLAIDVNELETEELGMLIHILGKAVVIKEAYDVETGKYTRTINESEATNISFFNKLSYEETIND